MINDNIALIKSTPRYTEAISKPNNYVALSITAANDNQLVQITFPVNPLNDGVATKVLVGNTIAINAIIKTVLYGKNSTTEAERNITDLNFIHFNDKETPDASMLALEEVLPSYPVEDSLAFDYTNVFFAFVGLRRNKIAEYTRIHKADRICIDNMLLCRAAHNVCSWLATQSTNRQIHNVRELVHACKVYDLHFCRSIKWLLTEAECHPCDAVDTATLSDSDKLFKERVVDPILAQYKDKRVPVYELIACTLSVPNDTYSAEVFKSRLKRCGVDIRYI